MLSAYKRKRLSKKPFCSVCGERIYSDEEVMYVTHRVGRCKVYDFFHPSCMINKSRRCTLGQKEKEETGKKEATNEVASGSGYNENKTKNTKAT